MDWILEEMESGLSSGHYFLALMMALTIPDICAALESKNGKSSSPAYKAWYQNHLSEAYKIAANDCWNLRCSLLHQGRSDNPNSEVERVIFTLPHRDQIVLHNNRIDKVVQIDLVGFCLAMSAAARRWFDATKENETVRRNLERLVRHYPDGFPGRFAGVEAIG